MRKCPNCQKAVPDGARRCVYCRSIVDVVERTEDYEEGLASQTYMGLTSRAMRDAENVRDKRRETLEDEEELNNHTLLGIRGVAPSLGNRPSRHTDKVTPQSTMVGLPGIVPDMSLSGSKISVRERNEPKIAEPVTPTQEDDPLAGLAGVAQKNTVSSLIDEEFEDLSTEILGISFEEGELDDIDNEWFDFEFGAKHAPENQKKEAVRKTPSVEMQRPVQENKLAPKTEDRRDATVLPLVEEIQPLNQETAARTEQKQKTAAPSAPNPSQERTGSELKELKRKKISVPEMLSVAASGLIALSLIVPSPVGVPLTRLSGAGTFQYFYVFTAVSALALIPIQISGKFTPLIKALVSVALCVLTIVCITKSVWATYMPQSLFLFAATALFIVSALILSVKKI